MLPVFADEAKPASTILFCEDWLYILCINCLILAAGCIFVGILLRRHGLSVFFRTGLV